jgi:hypothetical protein
VQLSQPPNPLLYHGLLRPWGFFGRDIMSTETKPATDS